MVKKTHNITYHEMDSENIINPLKNPKCSVSKPDINALSFVIPNGEYGDFDNNNKKNIIAARGIENANGPLTA